MPPRVSRNKRAGSVVVVRGGKNGLTGAGSQWFSRATAGVPGNPKEYETGTVTGLSLKPSFPQ